MELGTKNKIEVGDVVFIKKDFVARAHINGMKAYKTHIYPEIFPSVGQEVYAVDSSECFFVVDLHISWIYILSSTGKLGWGSRIFFEK